MKLFEKLNAREQSLAMTDLVRRRGWKLIEEFLLEKKKELIKKICLKAGYK